MKPKVTCPVCNKPATGPYRYPAHGKNSTYYYTRYAHTSKGRTTWCHVKVKIKSGTFDSSKPLIIPSSITIEGTGRGAKRWKQIIANTEGKKK